MASDQEIDRALTTLQGSLKLTLAQVTSIRQLAVSRRDAARSIREQAKPKFDQLMALLDQPIKDPAAIGRATIELKAIHDQARAQRADFEQRFMSILDPTQQQMVNNLRSQAPSVAALHRLGLLGAPGFGPGRLMSSGVNPSERSIP